MEEDRDEVWIRIESLNHNGLLVLELSEAIKWPLYAKSILLGFANNGNQTYDGSSETDKVPPVQIKALQMVDDKIDLMDEVMLLNMTWNYTSIVYTPSKIFIRLNFSEPVHVSQYSQPDRLLVLLNLDVLQIPQKKLPSNLLLQTWIPHQIPEWDQVAVDAVSDSAATFTSVVLLGNFLLNLLLSLSLNELKSAINTM